MTIYSLVILLNLKPVLWSIFASNCCFSTCIQVPQETGKWSGIPISLRFFQFVMIHTVKGFSVVNEAEVDVSWNYLAFSMIQGMLAFWSLVLLSFKNPACTYVSFRFTYYWSLAWRILIITLLACEMSAIIW